MMSVLAYKWMISLNLFTYSLLTRRRLVTHNPCLCFMVLRVCITRMFLSKRIHNTITPPKACQMFRSHLMRTVNHSSNIFLHRRLWIRCPGMWITVQEGCTIITSEIIIIIILTGITRTRTETLWQTTTLMQIKFKQETTSQSNSFRNKKQKPRILVQTANSVMVMKLVCWMV